MNVIVAVDGDRSAHLAEELADEGITPSAVVAPAEIARALHDPASAVWALLGDADALLLTATRDALTPGVVAACDRHGVRILPLADRAGEVRLARSFGLREPLARGAEGWRIAEALRDAEPAPAAADRERGSVVAVWGPHGAPGRTTIAIELAMETARLRGHVALADADTHAPSIAIALGLPDEGPGFAAACRQVELGGLDATELTRLSVGMGGADGMVSVLPGLNRVGRWPELAPHRVELALEVCREWADVTVVDVAAAMEADEEIVSDMADGAPRRNGATLAALRAADRIVAIAAADPVGIARFLRGCTELRAVVGNTPVTVVVNRLRPGPVGIDGRGQIRRTLERFAGVDDVLFIPFDLRAADPALREARPVAEIAARSPLAQAVRRVAERIAGDAAHTPKRRRAGRGGVRAPRVSID